MNKALASILALTLFATTPANAGLKIVATLPDLGAIAKEVAGPDATVDVLASHAENPHYVDARPSHIVKLNKADLLVFNGAQLEAGWLPPLIVQCRNPSVQAGGAGHFDASQHVALTGRGVSDRSKGDVHPSGNPHFTADPRGGSQLARALGDRLARLDPAGADGYRARAAALSRQLEAFAATEGARFTALDAKKRRVVTYHASMDYLLDWLGLEAVATVEPKPGIAPTPGHTAQVLQAMKASQVRVVLQEGYYPRNTSQTLCKLASARLVVVDGGTRFQDGQTYLQHLEGITHAIYDAVH